MPFSTKSQSPLLLLTLSLGAILLTYRAVLFITTYQRRSRFIQEKGCKPCPKYPHKDPILGLDLFLDTLKYAKAGAFLPRLQERYRAIKGGCWTFSHVLIGIDVVSTADPENIKAVLATQFQDFELSPRRKAALKPVFGHGIFSADGKEWETSRALLRPNFARSQVGDLDTFESHITAMIARIPRDGSTTDLQKLFFMLTMDTATEFLFGTSTQVLDHGPAKERGDKFSDAFGYITEKSGVHARLGKLVTLFPDKRFDEGVKFVHEYVQSYVKRGVEVYQNQDKFSTEQSSRYVFLEELAKTGVNEKKLQDELLNILLAGRDTTASLLSFLFYILARRPDVFKRLRAEVLSLGDERPTFEQIKSLKYLQYCLNETLRLYPIVPANGRTAVRDTILPRGGGPDGKSPIFLKAGTQVAYQVYVMHRREDLYGPDAAEFKPERWESFRPGWQYLPFNGGPRICIGQQFALTEASYTTIRILQTFKEIEPRDDSPLLELLTLTAAVRGGVQVSLVPA